MSKRPNVSHDLLDYRDSELGEVSLMHRAQPFPAGAPLFEHRENEHGEHEVWLGQFHFAWSPPKAIKTRERAARKHRQRVSA